MADIDPTEGLPSAAQQVAEEEELRELEAHSGGLTWAEVARRALAPEPVAADGRLTFRKVDAVYRSGNATRDDIPPHLVGTKDLPPAMEAFLEHVCPAGVYEAGRAGLVVNAPNCVDCKATDVVGPRWMPREGGSGPQYKRM